MYLTLAVLFGIGFALLYVILFVMGASTLLIIAFAIGFVALQWYISPSIIKFMAHLRYISDNELPELHETVKDLAYTAKVPVPRIALSPSTDPNAFVFGRTRKSATLVVHQGLLNMVDKNELRAVLAHEIGHIKHNDFAVMTVISFIPMLAFILARSLLFSGMFGGNRNSSAYLLLLGFAGFVVYMFSELLMMAMSRARESYADLYSAGTTQHPEHLASALVKITYGTKGGTAPAVNKAFYIADSTRVGKDIAEIESHAAEITRLLPNLDLNEFKQKLGSQHRRGSALLSMFSTHPATYKRLIALANAKKAQQR